jgi:hypothetical protein
MRRRDTSSGRHSEEQAAQQVQPGAPGTGATGPGTTAGAAATGGTSATTTGATTTSAGTTSTGLRERGMQDPAAAGYQRGAPAAGGYEMREEAGRGLGAGGSMAGGVLAVLAGLLSFFAGLALVLRNGFYPTLPHYAYRLNVNSWGWILFALGICLFAAGASHLLGIPFARAAAIALGVLTAIGAFLALPYTPIWAVLLVLVSTFAVWALVRGRRASI